jgi:hypothetical protein
MFAGRQLARDGVSLDEALERLRQTWRTVRGVDPTFESTKALATGWSNTSLAFMHQMTCEDPLTGLASQAHLRTRLQDLYRSVAVVDAPATHALVVCEIAWGDPAGQGRDQLTRSMRLAQVGDHVRTVFGHGEPVARLGAFRVAVLTARDDRLGRRVLLLRRLLAGIDPQASDPRVWIEGVPASEHTAAILLDELARS